MRPPHQRLRSSQLLGRNYPTFVHAPKCYDRLRLLGVDVHLPLRIVLVKMLEDSRALLFVQVKK